jgi:hypothetical protein
LSWVTVAFLFPGGSVRFQIVTVSSTLTFPAPVIRATPHYNICPVRDSTSIPVPQMVNDLPLLSLILDTPVPSTRIADPQLQPGENESGDPTVREDAIVDTFQRQRAVAAIARRSSSSHLFKSTTSRGPLGSSTRGTVMILPTLVLISKREE